MTVPSVAEVAVLLPMRGSYSYRVPDGWTLGEGARVWGPFGRRDVEGVVLSVGEDDGGRELKRIAGRVEAPPLAAEVIALGRWVAGYYLAPLGEALRLCLPPGGRAS